MNKIKKGSDSLGKKKKSIAALGAAIAGYENHRSDAPTSAVQQLVEAFLSTNNPAKRQKRIAEIKSKHDGIAAMLAENSELVASEVEQALLRAATGYSVTDTKEKIVNGRRSMETIKKHIPPSQSAIEFYLINKKPEDYSRTGGKSANGDGKISEILEALKNA